MELRDVPVAWMQPASGTELLDVRVDRDRPIEAFAHSRPTVTVDFTAMNLCLFRDRAAPPAFPGELGAISPVAWAGD